MPKKIDPQRSARCVRREREHAQEYPTVTAATAARSVSDVVRGLRKQ